MGECNTKYGKIEGVTSISYYSTGEINECTINDYCEINTALGTFVPRYEDDGVRSKSTKSLSFYKNGDIKSISLNERTVVNTPIDAVKAELITFYKNEKIRKVFPLNGQITGFWNEQNEYELAEEMEFDFPFGSFNNKIICISFYDSGKLKGLTLWPKDNITIETPCGTLNVRIGITVYENGKLKSCEPVKPVQVETPIGSVIAYDINALGVDGDKNSLNFYEDGEIKSLYTSTDKIEVYDKNGHATTFQPKLKPGLFNDNVMDIIPFNIEFYDGKVRFNDSEEESFQIDQCIFKISNFSTNITKETNSCTGCDE